MNDTRLTSIFGMDLKVLYLFLDDQEEWLSLSDATKLLDGNKMTVRRSLGKLVETDLLEEKFDGYRRSFRLKGSYINSVLQRMKNADSEIIGSLIGYFQGKVDAMVLYGSRAEGTSGPDSDWDVLVVSDDMDPLEINRVENNMERKFGELLNLHLYTKDQVIRMRNKRSPFYLELLKKNIPLVGDLDDIR
ncbi:MAG: nucleotidyltransferase domain-containing protein [Candidatus Thermoplasmatota archaeon]|nr:nucleotidyltransferase domain-containing protein [Candidatus Thermoplasmatota archaeon]